MIYHNSLVTSIIILVVQYGMQKCEKGKKILHNLMIPIYNRGTFIIVIPHIVSSHDEPLSKIL